MALLNYTTQIQAIKTVGEIQGILAGHGAKAILMNYDSQGNIESLSFQIVTPHGEMGIRLPVDPKAVLRVLEKQKVPARLLNHPQATRIAWRIVKDWVKAQMAILETEMVKMEQIFLPYVIMPNSKTLYEFMETKHFQLPEGKSKNEE